MTETAEITTTLTKSYAAHAPGTDLAPFEIQRREVGPRDVAIDIAYCGVCHSDIHQVRDEWGKGIFPMVPGHEIAGRVTQVGSDVKKFHVGDLAGVGCMVNSCRKCGPCQGGDEQFCETQTAWTYNSLDMDGVTPTYGGYSTRIVVDHDFVLKIPAHLDLARTAPLLCAGITTYSPLRHWKVGPGQRVGIVGLGGLGHMAVQFASKFGAEVTVFSTSHAKEADARRLGAHHFVVAHDQEAMATQQRKFDFILSTISAHYSLKSYVELLKVDGTLAMVGIPSEAPPLDVMPLVFGRRSVAGSLIGGIRETQEMLDFCGQHNIMSDIELISADQINDAYERVLKSEVRYRFVIDTKTL